MHSYRARLFFFFFFNDPATTEIYTLPLHDALPISKGTFTGQLISVRFSAVMGAPGCNATAAATTRFVFGRVLACVRVDRKSTRLNSSHGYISYAVFCLKKKKTHNTPPDTATYYPTY